MPIDLRSDTVTKPSGEMLQAMVRAEVGDDVFGEDPTVNALENNVARLFGMESGLFVPSGTMGNQLSVKILTRPGDEVLIEETGHLFNYEAAASSLISSVQLRTVKGNRGKLQVDDLMDTVRGNYVWEPRTRVIAIENTTNKGGGACYSKEELEEIGDFAKEHKLKVHLDGARIWNAVTATNIEPRFFGTVADTLTVSFSKGLGAPAGSMMLSTEKRIRKARRYRKMLGGGMRQVGVLAAAADYAIEHNWSMLENDHRRARVLAETIDSCSGLFIDLDSVETNILIFEVFDHDAETAVKKMEEEGVKMVPFGPKTVRATFHFQIGDEELQQAKKVIRKLFD